MCIGLEKLKAHSMYIVWIVAMATFSLLFWFTVTPLLFPYSGVKGKALSRTYIPEFGLIGLIFWIIFLTVCWCCFRNVTREKDDFGESSRVISNPEEAKLAEGLSSSVKKRLGLLTPNDSVGSLKNEEKVEISKEEEVRLHVVKVEARDVCQEGDKLKKRGLISRLSSLRRNRAESDEPQMNIVALPDFTTENGFRLLMANECENCFPEEGRTAPFAGNQKNASRDCGKVHHATESHNRLSWNSRKRRDLNIDLGEDVSTDGCPTPDFFNLDEMISEEGHIREGKLDDNKLEEEDSARNERKGLKTTEGSFLLQSLHDQKKSKSEVFFVVNEYGRVMDEPTELAELHGFKH